MTPQTGQPWWAALMAKYGPMTAIAVFLIWWLTSVVAASLGTIQTSLTEHVRATNVYLRAVCLHTARTTAERDDCPVMPEK